MNRPQRFKKSVEVLSEAYFNGTLKPGKPCACAVGNLVAAEIGADTEENAEQWPDHSRGSDWYGAMLAYKKLTANPDDYKGEITKCLDYTNAEVVKIEDAFENSEGPLINKLLGVLEVLFEIHKVEDQPVRQKAKKAFA